MKLKKLMKLNRGGVACISIHQEPYDWYKNRYTKTYFEEEVEEKVLKSDKLKEIANKKVHKFCVISHDVFSAELVITLEEE